MSKNTIEMTKIKIEIEQNEKDIKERKICFLLFIFTMISIAIFNLIELNL